MGLLVLAGLCLVNLIRITPQRNTSLAQVKTEQFLTAHQGESLEALHTRLNRILESPNRSFSDRMCYGLLRNQVEYLLGFSTRLEEVQAQAEHMSSVSIFAGSPYSQANIQKTASDYRRLEGLEVTPGHDRAVEQVLGVDLSDWLLGAYMALVVSSFLEERKRGLWNLVCASPSGRLGLPVWRLCTVALAALLGSAVLTCVELSHAYWMYGGLDELNRVLQSVSLFQNFTYPMTHRRLLALLPGPPDPGRVLPGGRPLVPSGDGGGPATGGAGLGIGSGWGICPVPQTAGDSAAAEGKSLFLAPPPHLGDQLLQSQPSGAPCGAIVPRPRGGPSPEYANAPGHWRRLPASETGLRLWMG